MIDVVAPPAWAGKGAMFGSNVLQRWFVADAYERLGRLDSAAVYFELLVRPKRMNFVQSEQLGFAHSFALRRLALLYDRMGQPAQARRHWQQFLDTFTDPDPELRPLVVEARAALALLVAAIREVPSNATVAPAGGSRLAATTTRAPFAAKAWAVALPIPLLAPVIRATRPGMSDILDLTLFPHHGPAHHLATLW